LASGIQGFDRHLSVADCGAKLQPLEVYVLIEAHEPSVIHALPLQTENHLQELAVELKHAQVLQPISVLRAH
jgi:hypothetical protein